MRLQKKKKELLPSVFVCLPECTYLSYFYPASRRLRNFLHGLRLSEPSIFLCSMFS